MQKMLKKTALFVKWFNKKVYHVKLYKCITTTMCRKFWSFSDIMYGRKKRTTKTVKSWSLDNSFINYVVINLDWGYSNFFVVNNVVDASYIKRNEDLHNRYVKKN